jgi:hypothetical protein
MPKIRMVAPGVDKDGNVLGTGGEYDVDDETAHNLRMDGKAINLADEQAQIKASKEGNYSARTGRAETGGGVDAPAPRTAKTDEPPPGPSSSTSKGDKS